MKVWKWHCCVLCAIWIYTLSFFYIKFTYRILQYRIFFEIFQRYSWLFAKQKNQLKFSLQPPNSLWSFGNRIPSCLIRSLGWVHSFGTATHTRTHTHTLTQRAQMTWSRVTGPVLYYHLVCVCVCVCVSACLWIGWVLSFWSYNWCGVGTRGTMMLEK